MALIEGHPLVQFQYWLGDLGILGPKQEAQAALFYEFSLENHVPQDHLIRSIDRFVDLNGIRQYLGQFLATQAALPSIPSY